MSNKINAIILGATGMVGEGVLHECLKHANVDSVLVINRRTCGIASNKLKEIIHNDFFNFSPLESQLAGYNACYFCLGVSSFGMNEKDYMHVSYDLTMHVADTLVKINPDMTFCYVSGAGTDNTEQGSTMWARVKGKTENSLLKLPFKDAYMFRAGYIQPTQGLKNTYKVYKLLAPFYTIWKLLFPKYVSTLEEIGLAMIHSTSMGYNKRILECKDIVQLAQWVRAPHL